MKKIIIALLFSISTALWAEDIAGGLMGGAIGGIIGNQFGRGDGKVAMTITGAVIGSIMGSNVQQSSQNYSNESYTPNYPSNIVYGPPQTVYESAPVQQQIVYSHTGAVYTQPGVIYIEQRPFVYNRDNYHWEHHPHWHEGWGHEWHDDDW